MGFQVNSSIFLFNLISKLFSYHQVIFFISVDDDIDGVPMDDDDSTSSKGREDKKISMPAGFVPSRWETVDPDQVEAQAMTTSKWEELEQNDDSNSQDTSMDSRYACIIRTLFSGLINT